MPKNIIVLSDGTGQDGGKGHDSNVYKLFRMLEDRTDDQIVFYDEGLGTGPQRLTGLAFGAGIDTNILQCYRFIFDNYKSGDRIFLFGFSRGAATVRSLASFIHYFGILPASRPELIKEAYSIYMNRKRSYDQSASRQEPSNGLFRFIDNIFHRVNQSVRDDLDDAKHGKSAEFVRKHPNQWVQIEFLGVWDTVPALGLVAAPGLDALVDRVPAWKHQYHNFKLRASVKHACHALSIDDERKWFFPSIWKEYADSTQTVEQVWFGGAHTDVGGGFWEAGFSDIALEWMIQKAFEHGMKLYLGSRKYWNFCLAPDSTDEFHDPRSAWGFFYTSGKRDKVWDKVAFESFGPPRVHESVLERAAYFPRTADIPKDTEYYPWVLENYPGADVMDARFKKKYLDESQRLFNLWKDANGQKFPGTLDEWMSQPENSFEGWMARNDYVFKEFNGVKFLVEKYENVVYDPAGNALLSREVDGQSLMTVMPPRIALVFRDYDRGILPEILKDTLVYESIKDRGRRVATKSGNLTRAMKKLSATNPDAIPYVYRIDRDEKRWNISMPEPPASGPDAH